MHLLLCYLWERAIHNAFVITLIVMNRTLKTGVKNVLASFTASQTSELLSLVALAMVDYRRT